MKRKKTSHKGENGKLLMIGGSDDFPGALILCAKAAFRTGVDNVTAMTTKKAKMAINCLFPDMIVYDRWNADFIIELSKRFDAVIIGPGVGKNKKGIKKICEKINIPKVIDADALRAIDMKKIENAIFTPHRNEYEDLVKKGINLKNNIIVLKGHHDKIITSSKTYINKTGNEGMTVNGTGDVLAGAIGGLLAISHNMIYSARKGTRIVGMAGDRLRKKYGYGFMASDVADEIASILQ